MSHDKKIQKIVSDIGSERAVLSGICQYGKDGFIDVCDIISVDTFTIDSNKALYKCLVSILKETDKVDITSIIAKAEELHLTNLICKEKSDIEYLRSLFSFPLHKDNIRTHAAKIAKLEFTRKAQDKHVQAYKALQEVKGSETLESIINISEKPVFDLIDDIARNKSNNPQKFGSGSLELLQNLENNQCDNIGIPTPYSRYNVIIGGGLRRGGVDLIGARPKCLDLNTIVYTRYGPKTIQEIEVGDELCHPYGGYTKVLSTNINNDSTCYEITFSDETKIICTSNHRWYVQSRRTKGYQTLTTEQMINNGLYYGNRPKYEIITTTPVSFEEKSISIDPYFIGSLFENYKDNHIYTHKEIFIIGSQSEDKFIPDVYKYNTIEIRQSLIQGIFDTKGLINFNEKNIEYTTKSLQFALDVKEVLESLGFLVTKKQNIINYNNKTIYSYTLYIKGYDYSVLFRLPRNKELCKKIITDPIHREIISIKEVSKRITKCVTVDRSDELFLINGFIATKNSGKSTHAINIGLHTAGTLKIPTLYLDTEMDLEPQQHRILACLSKVHISNIETGKFAKTSDKNKLYNSQKLLEDIPFFHISVAGKPFEEILSIIRRWIIKEVGFEGGRTNNCLIIYDYFKLMNAADLNNMQEFQALGFQISHLSDFSKEYDFPCLAYVQLNRSGIDKDTSDIISQSDRLLWLCQSASYIRRKTKEEIVQDGKENGNVKLQTLECRYGSGLEDGDYINLDLEYGYFKMKELNTKSDLIKKTLANTDEDIDF